MTNGYYILEGKKPVLCDDIMQWARFMKKNDARIVKHTRIEKYEILISTVFLGIDHNWSSKGEPVLFETMIFGMDRDDEFQDRCCTWQQAESQHELAIIYFKQHFTIWKKISRKTEIVLKRIQKRISTSSLMVNLFKELHLIQVYIRERRWLIVGLKLAICVSILAMAKMLVCLAQDIMK